ncbi:hypothetical protein KPH14_004214 [Odynerus spinipes]|uniref:Tubulin delta chain n=1 Tax=Odynerus spinipes TaxID=1348599 RepID=A0AAD9RZQ0_9HYME|nr:hypothetical protein KPH14_004214 [Odynerus spinipes]
MLALQFGQCGNQLGHTLFSKLSADIDAKKTGVPSNVNCHYIAEVFDKWFCGLTKDGKRLARAILIDTEEKVINKVTDNKCGSWTYCTKNVLYQAAGGSGNNWAYGYMEKGDKFSESTLEIIQCELEKLDHFDGFLLLLGSAGGTGSGIGSHMVELLREEYKTKYLVGTIVLPFLFGEIGTQNYNTLLTMVKFLDNADGIFLFENEDIHLTFKNSNMDVKLEDINDVISQNLSVVLQPINHIQNSLHLLMSRLIVEPCYKLASIKTVPLFSISSEHTATSTWQSYLYELKRMLKAHIVTLDKTDMESKGSSHVSNTMASFQYGHSVSNILITRGTCSDQDIITTDDLRYKHLYADWVTTDPFTHLHQQRHILNQDKALAILTNNSNAYRSIDTLLRKAWNSYIHSAFLHHYKRFGLEDDDFLRTFAKIESVLKDYKELDGNDFK